MSSRGARYAAAWYLAILLVLFHPLLFGRVMSPGAVRAAVPPFLEEAGANPTPYVNTVQGDVWRQFVEYQHEQHRAAREGRFPTWNPYIFCGFPLHGNGQTSFLNPFGWIYFLLDPEGARGPMAILRLLMTGTALFALLRRFGVGAEAALLGGAVWMLGSFNIRWLLWPHSYSAVWLPVILLAIDRYVDRPGPRSFAWASLAATALFLSGHPGTQWLVGLVCGLYVLVKLLFLRGGGMGLRRLLARASGSVAIMLAGVLGAAVSVLPLALQIARSVEPGETRGALGLLSWNSLWLFIAPFHFGWERAGFKYHGPINSCEMSYWFGLPALALALSAGFLLGDRRRRSLLLVFGIVLFVVSLVVSLGVVPVPGSEWTSYRRLLMGVQLAGAILAALAADALLEARNQRLGIIALSLVAAMTAALGSIVITTHGPALAGVVGSLSVGSLVQHPAFRTVVGACIALVACGIFASQLRSIRKGAGPGRAPGMAIVAIVVIDLLWAAWDFNPIAPRRLADPPAPASLGEIVALQGSDRLVAVGRLLEPNAALRYGLRDVRGYDLPRPSRLRKVQKALGSDEDTWLFDPTVIAKNPVLATYLERCATRLLFARVFGDPANAALADAFPVASANPSAATVLWPRIRAWPDGASLYVNPRPFPRAFLPRRVTPGSDLLAFRTLLDPSADLLEQTVVEPGASTPDLPEAALWTGSVRITRDDEEVVELESSSPTGGMVVLHDRMDDGWRVSVDGRPAEGLYANYLFRAVRVPPGTHTIRWTYHLPGFAAGIVVSLLTLAGLVWLAARRSERGDGMATG